MLESDTSYEQGYEVFSEELYANKDGGNNLQTVGGMGETQKFIEKNTVLWKTHMIELVMRFA